MVLQLSAKCTRHDDGMQGSFRSVCGTPNTRTLCLFNTVLNDRTVGVPFADLTRRVFNVDCSAY
jgi:hypothetical protein